MRQKILIVDDSETFREQLGGLCEDEGCLVDTVSSGEEALQILQNQNYDLIFIDYLIPGLDGLETSKKIREIQATVPIYLVTSHNINPKQLTEAGITGYIPKNAETIDIFRKNLAELKEEHINV